MKKTFILIIWCVLSFYSESQSDSKNYVGRFNVNLNLGTSLFYNSGRVNFESPSFFKSQKHVLKLSAGIGLWQFSFLDSNKGFLFNSKLVYIMGAKNNHFELDLGASVQYDVKENESNYSYLSTAPNVFIGYRFQNPDKKLMFKAGLGFVDIIQVGVGYSF